MWDSAYSRVGYPTAVLLEAAAEPSLPLMAVVALVSSVAGGAVTATLAVVGFIGRQRDNARAIQKLNEKLEGTERDLGVLQRVEDLEKWKSHSERKHSAVKKSLEDQGDHLIHRLWPDSSA